MFFERFLFGKQESEENQRKLRERVRELERGLTRAVEEQGGEGGGYAVACQRQAVFGRENGGGWTMVRWVDSWIFGPSADMVKVSHSVLVVGCFHFGFGLHASPLPRVKAR